MKYADAIGILLVRKLLNMLEWLTANMNSPKEFPGFLYWEEFTKEKDFKDIKAYVQKEYDVFKVFYDSVHNRVK